MSGNEKKIKNERLTKLLMQYPTVFLDTQDVSNLQHLSKTSLIKLETEIINHITTFLIDHNELGRKKHSTPKTIIVVLRF